MSAQRTCHARGLCGAAIVVGSLALTAVAFGAESVTDLPLRAGGSAEIWRTGVKAIFVAVLCLALLAGVLYAWRHRLRLPGAVTPSNTAAANLAWARRISPRTTLLVVRWGAKQYLLAENGGATQVIDTRADEGSPT